MEIIIHRVNKIKDLKKIPKVFGTEIDIRSYGSKLILNHEPKMNGDNFENYLENYKNGTLVLNIKESGIEDEVLSLVKKFNNIKKYFLLDVEIPYLFKSLKTYNKNSAIRFSYYEPLSGSIKFKKIFNWIWIDTLKKFNLTNKDIEILKKFNLCLVCPERWGNAHQINYYKNFFKRNNLKIDAVMTSLEYLDKWK
jgi:hypothetical protein|tara:strand:+ start:824 stop:1408 length:585 start_codon:yes stop_codon:yes gene_type:complete